jgi:hypothetical protein
MCTAEEFYINLAADTFAALPSRGDQRRERGNRRCVRNTVEPHANEIVRTLEGTVAHLASADKLCVAQNPEVDPRADLNAIRQFHSETLW